MIINEKFELHEQLNYKLWLNNKLRTDVRNGLLNIVDEFINYCDIPIKVLDAVIVGSNASYNYTSNSDIDLHLVVSFDGLDGSDEILHSLYNLEKASFNKSYDFKIKGLEVELSVEDVMLTSVSNGRYSVIKDEWIKFPEKIQVQDFDTTLEVFGWISKIESGIQTCSSKELQNIVDQLYLMRKNSIDSEGEFGKGNQIFKDIRQLGYLKKLKDAVKNQRSKELTVESL